MLISCPECGYNSVSSSAPACPMCGKPMRTQSSVLPGRDHVQLVERTGKFFKLGMVIGLCMVVGGCMVGMSGGSESSDRQGAAMVTVIGLVVTVVCKFLAWWNHG